jgi:MarR family transcriptional regulator, transcriptional regulator for hemolysin
MGKPDSEPVGLLVTRTAKVVSRAFDQALTEAGGSLPVWVVLVSLKGGTLTAQRELADAVGIEGPTLTHHLNRMEAAGLVTRRRDPDDRRAHHVALTEDGEAAFRRMVQAVAAFDARLRAGLSNRELSALRGLLDRLRTNVAAPDRPAVS